MTAVLWNRETGLVAKIEIPERYQVYRLPMLDEDMGRPLAHPPDTPAAIKHLEFEFWGELCGVDLYLERI